MGKGTIQDAGVLAGSLPPVQVIAIRSEAQFGRQPACSHPGDFKIARAVVMNAGHRFNEGDGVGSPVQNVGLLGLGTGVVDAAVRNPLGVGGVTWVHLAVGAAAAKVVATAELVAVIVHVIDIIDIDVVIGGNVE